MGTLQCTQWLACNYAVYCGTTPGTSEHELSEAVIRKMSEHLLGKRYILRQLLLQCNLGIVSC